ncbi:hypothetical protein [Mycobacterium lepromatosis]|uniref:hypothetical protein n=1 Tax=Mycobacterium lepromatosis TaxID=480418 RepID=UPI000A6C8784|nr:hypothetical protein [Mycobacterium lepromatosis]
MLRSRNVEMAFLDLIPQPFTTSQLLCRTMDMNVKPEAMVTMVILPGQTGPLSSYQCAIEYYYPTVCRPMRCKDKAKAFGSLTQFKL